MRSNLLGSSSEFSTAHHYETLAKNFGYPPNSAKPFYTQPPVHWTLHGFCKVVEQAKRGGFLRGCFSDEALAAAEPLIETPEFTADDLCRLCAQANVVNPLLLVISS